MAKEEQKIPGSWQQVRTAYPKWAHPFIWIEWVTEWIVYGLSRWAFIDLLQLIAALSIVWVAFDYVLSADERQRLQNEHQALADAIREVERRKRRDEEQNR